MAKQTKTTDSKKAVRKTKKTKTTNIKAKNKICLRCKKDVGKYIDASLEGYCKECDKENEDNDDGYYELLVSKWEQSKEYKLYDEDGDNYDEEACQKAQHQFNQQYETWFQCNRRMAIQRKKGQEVEQDVKLKVSKKK
jgi:hypothetical protein